MTQIQVQNQALRENARANRVNEAINRRKLEQTDTDLFLKMISIPINTIGQVAKVLG